jgi:hypothetical protein
VARTCDRGCLRQEAQSEASPSSSGLQRASGSVARWRWPGPGRAAELPGRGCLRDQPSGVAPRAGELGGDGLHRGASAADSPHVDFRRPSQPLVTGPGVASSRTGRPPQIPSMPSTRYQPHSASTIVAARRTYATLSPTKCSTAILRNVRWVSGGPQRHPGPLHDQLAYLRPVVGDQHGLPASRTTLTQNCHTAGAR